MALARTGAWLFLLAGFLLVPFPIHAFVEAQAAAGSRLIDPARSSARFIVHLRWRLRTQGRMTGVAGELRGDPGQGWSVLVNVDGRSLKVSGPRWMDKATRSDAFLAVDSHPEIRFESDRFSDRLLHAGGRIRGRLTLRGLTRPVSFRLLPSACAQPGRDCDLQVHGTISRTAFGMTAHPSTVKDDVDLHMRVRLQPAGSAR